MALLTRCYGVGPFAHALGDIVDAAAAAAPAPVNLVTIILPIKSTAPA